MTTVLLACRDLMTSSRLELAAGVDVVRAGSEDRLDEELQSHPDAVVVVDLTAFADVPGRIRASEPDRVIVAFAPHVHEDLLDAAREHADLVVPRGSVMQGLDRQVRRAIEARAGH